jgi:transcriptional regulator with XRE-family HTH domain
MGEPTVTTIRRMREAAGLSIRDLSRLTGINRGRLSIIERGVVASEDETALILAALRNGSPTPTQDAA